MCVILIRCQGNITTEFYKLLTLVHLKPLLQYLGFTKRDEYLPTQLQRCEICQCRVIGRIRKNCG